MKRFGIVIVLMLVGVLAAGCGGTEGYSPPAGDDSSEIYGYIGNGLGASGDYSAADEVPLTNIEILAASAGFSRFEAEIENLAFSHAGNVNFEVIHDYDADFSIDLTFPVTGEATLDSAVESMISARADAFRAVNESGFFFVRSHVHRQDNHFSSFAIYFRSYGDVSGFHASKDTVNFDLHNTRFIEMQNMFAANSDFTDVLAQLAEPVLNGRNITGTEDFTFNNDTLYLHLGGDTIDFSVADLDDIWLGNAPLRRGPIAALTFDDGPMYPYTADLLDMLKEFGVPATFFLLGIQVERHPDIVLRMYQEGHQIGNHSMGHPNFAYLNRTQIHAEIYYTNRLIEGITGHVPTTLRPPFGIRDATVLDVAAELDLSVILWSVDPQDWLFRDAAIVSEHVISHTNDGSVILLHDIRRPSIDATMRIIEQLLADGFTFVTIDELFAYNAITLEAGEVFHSPYRTARR